MTGRGNFFTGASYLIAGAKLLTHPRLRLFVIVPLLINTLLFFALTTYLINSFTGWLNYFMEWLPGWLDFLAWIVGFVLALLIVLVYGYSFSLITNLIAAPFYGILAEKVEEIKTSEKLAGESLLQLIPRTLFRELRKFWYFLWRGVLVFLLTFFVPIVGPILGALWAAWCMSIQYGDYAADNHQTEFIELRSLLSSRIWSSLGFGGLVMLGMMVPILNIFVMPAAVVGGTLFWLKELR